MLSSILQTKLLIPLPVRECVTRSRLLDSLDLGLNSNHRLIMVSVMWISLDEADNDLFRFLAYFITALQQFDPSLGEDALSILQSPQSAPIEIILTELINQITSLAKQIVLVLDDYHLIKDKSIHAVINLFLENQPPGTHLVIISRADPPIPLARYRARNQMTELRVADLRLTVEEITIFLKEYMHLDLSRDQIKSLDVRTEGWVAGLQLAALSLKGKDDIDRFITDRSGYRYRCDSSTCTGSTRRRRFIQVP